MAALRALRTVPALQQYVKDARDAGKLVQVASAGGATVRGKNAAAGGGGKAAASSKQRGPRAREPASAAAATAAAGAAPARAVAGSGAQGGVWVQQELKGVYPKGGPAPYYAQVNLKRAKVGGGGVLGRGCWVAGGQGACAAVRGAPALPL